MTVALTLTPVAPLLLRPDDHDADVALDRVRAEVTRRRARKSKDAIDVRPTLDRMLVELASEQTWGFCAIAASLLGPELALEGGEGELAARAAMGARGMAIAGGTSEVTRNQIAERILGMPRDPLIV